MGSGGRPRYERRRTNAAKPTAADVRALARRPTRRSLRKLLAIAKERSVGGMTRVHAAKAVLRIAYGPPRPASA